MKGMEIAKEFFLEWGYPFLKENYSEIAGRMAAGRSAQQRLLAILEVAIARVP